MDVKTLIETDKKKMFQVYSFVNEGARDLNLIEKIILSSAIWFTYNKNGLGTNPDWLATNLGCSQTEVKTAMYRLLGLGYIQLSRQEGSNWDRYIVNLETINTLVNSK